MTHMGEKIFIISVLTSRSLFSFAQIKGHPNRKGNLPFFEKSKFHSGFSLGVNSSGFQMKTDKITERTTKITSETMFYY